MRSHIPAIDSVDLNFIILVLEEQTAMEQKKAPKYLFVLPWSINHPGGVNQVVANLYQQFLRQGRYRPLLMSMDWNSSTLRLEREQNFDTVYYRLRSPSNPERPIRGVLLFVATAPIRLFALWRFLRAEKVEVINPHYPTLECLNFALLKGLGLFRGKLILSLHGADVANASKEKAIGRFFWKLLLSSADSIVTCSTSLAKTASTFFPGIAHKTSVVHNGVNIGKISNDVDRSTFQERLEDHPFILNVATFEPKKGQDVLLRAFHQIKNQFPDLRLVLIGRSGNEQEIENLAIELGVSERLITIRDLGHDRVTAFFERASIFVLPSRIEPFGIVILEAGVFGVPVVATAVGGVPEIIEHGITGYLLPPEDPSILATKLTFLLRNPQERARLGGNLHRHVRENFDWQNAYLQYARIVG